MSECQVLSLSFQKKSKSKQAQDNANEDIDAKPELNQEKDTKNDIKKEKAPKKDKKEKRKEVSV